MILGLKKKKRHFYCVMHFKNIDGVSRTS